MALIFDFRARTNSFDCIISQGIVYRVTTRDRPSAGGCAG
jgi:hypothetical protein